MRVKAAVRQGFVRLVYESASPATVEGRKAYLSALNSTAHTNLLGSVQRVGASGGGFSSSFAAFANWDNRDVIELAQWARAYISEDDVEDAVALVPGPVRYYGTDNRLVRL